MKHRLLAVFATAFLAACSGQSSSAPPPAAATKPLSSGVDPAGFDKAIRPQDDLYKFVNGGWLAKTEIPADKGAYGGFYEAIDRTQDRLHEIVEAAAKAPNKAAGSDQQKLGDFFTAFMDEARANQLGKTPLEPELARIDALKSKDELVRHMARMVKLNMTSVAGGFVDGDAQDPKTAVLYLSQSGLGLPDRDYYLKDDPKLKEYRDQVPRLCHEDADPRGAVESRGGCQGDRRVRDEAGAIALDERREPRCGEDIQQGGARGTAQTISGFRLVCLGG